MSGNRGVIIRKPHKGGLIPDFHEPIWLGEHQFRDTLARLGNGGYTRWMRIVCNNPGCTFEAWLNPEEVVRTVEVEQ